jgi:hypothetical protein
MHIFEGKELIALAQTIQSGGSGGIMGLKTKKVDVLSCF